MLLITAGRAFIGSKTVSRASTRLGDRHAVNEPLGWPENGAICASAAADSFRRGDIDRWLEGRKIDAVSTGAVSDTTAIDAVT